MKRAVLIAATLPLMMVGVVVLRMFERWDAAAKVERWWVDL